MARAEGPELFAGCTCCPGAAAAVAAVVWALVDRCCKVGPSGSALAGPPRWWGGWGSNPRPTDYEHYSGGFLTCTLTTRLPCDLLLSLSVYRVVCRRFSTSCAPCVPRPLWTDTLHCGQTAGPPGPGHRGLSGGLAVRRRWQGLCGEGRTALLPYLPWSRTPYLPRAGGLDAACSRRSCAGSCSAPQARAGSSR